LPNATAVDHIAECLQRRHPAAPRHSALGRFDLQYIDLQDEDGAGEATVEKVSLFVENVVDSDDHKTVLRCSAAVDLSISVSSLFTR
jgi:hypothetical protein